MLVREKIWRRPRAIASLLTALVIAATVASACQSQAPAAAPAATSVTSAAATSAAAAPAAATTTAPAAIAPTTAARKPQGTLVVGVASLGKGSVGLPSRVGDGDTGFQSGIVLESLLRVDEKGNRIPGLAEKWEVSPDGSKLTFYLRKGIQFHDGWGEFTADDVKFSYEDAFRDGSTARAKIGYVQGVKSVTVADKYTVVFDVDPAKMQTTVVAGFTNVPGIMFLVISKKHVESVGLDKAAATAVGTGPWRLVEWKTGDHATYEAVENHWRQTPYFKTLIMREVPESSSLVSMLRAGDVDLAVVPSDARKELENAGLKVVVNTPGMSAFIVLGGLIDSSHKNFDPKIPWVGDPRDATSAGNALKVRKALNMAVNRQQLLDTLLGGGQPSSVTMYVSGMDYYSPDWKIPFDPAQGKQLLKEAGYPDGFEFEMLLPTIGGRPWLPAMGEAVAMQWTQNLGLKIKRTPIDYTAINPMNQNRTLGLRTYPMGQANFSEPWFVINAIGRTTGQLSYLAQNPEIDRHLDKIVGEVDTGKRVSFLRQFGQYMYDNYLGVPIGTGTTLTAMGKKLGDYRLPWASTSMQELEYATPAR